MGKQRGRNLVAAAKALAAQNVSTTTSSPIIPHHGSKRPTAHQIESAGRYSLIFQIRTVSTAIEYSDEVSSRKHGVSLYFVRKWRKDEEGIRRLLNKSVKDRLQKKLSGVRNASSFGVDDVKKNIFYQHLVAKRLEKWFLKDHNRKNIPKLSFRKQAKKIASEIGLVSFKVSSEWIDKVMKRLGNQCRVHSSK